MKFEFKPISSKYIKTLEELKNQSIINALCIHSDIEKASKALKIDEGTIFNFCRKHSLSKKCIKNMRKLYQNGNNSEFNKIES